MVDLMNCKSCTCTVGVACGDYKTVCQGEGKVKELMMRVRGEDALCCSSGGDRSVWRGVSRLVISHLPPGSVYPVTFKQRREPSINQLYDEVTLLRAFVNYVTVLI